MLAAIDTKPAIRTLMQRHAALLEPFAAEYPWLLKAIAREFDGLGTVATGGPGDDWHLTAFLAALREYVAVERIKRTAAQLGSAPVSNRIDWLDGFADALGAYLVEGGILVAPSFAMTVVDATSAAELAWAEAIVATMQCHATAAIRKELEGRPAWQHPIVMEGAERTMTVMARSIDAASVIGVLGGLQDRWGPQDLFRVMVRDLSGLTDPVGMTDGEVLECAATRRALALLRILPARREPAALCLRLAIPGTITVLKDVGLSHNAWLAEDIGRWRTQKAFPVAARMPAAVAADMEELGLVERRRGRLVLTELGAEACQLALDAAAREAAAEA
jgi:hypothetical protein